ncbi:hypothetical protein D3C76_1355720 [compost metagenome]
MILYINSGSIRHTINISYLNGGDIMGFLKWLGGIVVFFWLLGLLFKVGGYAINVLLVIAAIVFIIDALVGRRKNY